MGALGLSLLALYEGSLLLARLVFAQRIKEQRQPELAETAE
jgi:Sec-independent protein secretion pathway component TatC